MQNYPQPPTPSPKIGRRGGNFKVPLPSLGEGFRVRAFDLCKKSNIGKRNNQTAVATTLGEIRNALPQLCADSPLAVEVENASAV